MRDLRDADRGPPALRGSASRRLRGLRRPAEETVFRPGVPVQGRGWYVTDYAGKGARPASEPGGDSGKKDAAKSSESGASAAAEKGGAVGGESGGSGGAEKNAGAAAAPSAEKTAAARKSAD